MASLEVLSNDAVSAFSRRQTRQKFEQDLDLALKEVESAYLVVKAANNSPVKKALKLLEEPDENATVVSIGREITTGRRNLTSLEPSELLLLRRALRTRRNSLAPISRLPTEVLAPILELCPAIDADVPDFATGNFVLGITVSHVCRRWREIAMKSPHFWAHIVVPSRPRWALELLKRSQAAPLTVGVNFGLTTTKHVVARDLVLAQLPRIRELHVRMPIYPASVPASLLLPAPNLETLALSASQSSPFFGQASLRHLSLRFCLLQRESPLWEGLVSLELVSTPINFVFGLPHLRALTLIESYPTAVETSEPVSLGLERLEITADASFCSFFLQGLILPNCRILLDTCDSCAAPIEIHRANADDPVLHGLTAVDRSLSSQGSAVFEVTLFTQPNPCNSPRYAVRMAPPPVSLGNWREEAMSIILTNVSLDQVTTFTGKSETLKLPASLLHVQHFRSATFHHFIQPFTAHLEGDPLMAVGDVTKFEPLYTAIYYPRLRKLAFHDIAFGERHMELMLDWLAQRKRLNVAITEIRLIDCTFTNAELGALREVVSRINVDSEIR
ncbi:hypothetical protein B0H16DRAFT_1563039 [Mycena metata]|uniref:F-box domain-containing protein n=1 Tax=Mycena metata TaxID=1033252 RepID=A0AAD7N2A0_9AGAR|nr:hypothetical protein B0H16DRAFT_1563039 [Mycena metata]